MRHGLSDFTLHSETFLRTLWRLLGKMDNNQILPPEPPLSDAELRILRLLVERAAQSGFDFGAHQSKWGGGRPFTVERTPLLQRRDFEAAGLAPPVDPEDNFGLDWPLLLVPCLLILWGIGTFAVNCGPGADQLCPELVSQTFATAASVGHLRPQATAAVMAPKTLPSPQPDLHRDVMPGGRCTFWDAAPVNFSTFAAVYNPQTFRELLMTRQVEQLFPSWPGVADFPQGLPDFVHTAMVTTLGMRLSWRRWNELLQNANVWNRRYVDFFVAMAGTLTLSHQQDAGTLQLMHPIGTLQLMHPIAPYVGVDYFNTLLQNPNSGFYRLFHIPIPAHFGARC